MHRKHIFSGISDYFRLFLTDALTPLDNAHDDDDGKEDDFDDIDNNYENCGDDHDQWCSQTWRKW